MTVNHPNPHPRQGRELKRKSPLLEGVLDDQPFVSVIMNCLDGEKYLSEAIASVYAQTYQNWELIFWDNASTDKTPVIAQSYDSRLRYFRGDITIPLGAARNRAIEQAAGEFIAFLDVDDGWLPDKLEKQLPLFSDPSIGVVFSDACYFNEAGYRRPLYGNSIPPQGDVYRRILFSNFTCLSTVVIRSIAIKEGDNWFDADIHQIEDADILMRLARQWKFAYSPHVLCDYRMHTGGLTFSNLLLTHKEEEALFHKYEQNDPHFELRYGRMCMQKIKYNRAMTYWMTGNNATARAIMREIFGRKWKYVVVYFSMFLPYKVALLIRARCTRRAILHY